MDNGPTPSGKKIERFVRQHFRGGRNGEDCTHLILRHVTPNAQKGGSEIITIERPGKLTDDVIGDIAMELETTAENDASGLGGAQSYVVQAFYGSDKRPKGRCTFRAEGLSDIDSEYESEPATVAGMATQQMRHNEALTRALIMSQHQITNVQKQMIEALHDRNVAMERVHFDLIVEREKLLDGRLERELQVREHEANLTNKQELIGTLKTYAPIALNKLNGRKSLPAADPTALMIQRLHETLTKEQFFKLQEIMTPDQLAIVAELFEGQSPQEE